MSNNFRIQEEMGWVGFNLDKLAYWKCISIDGKETLYMYFSGTETLIFRGKTAQKLIACLKDSFWSLSHE